MTTQSRILCWWAGLAIVGLLGFTACGDDSDDSTAADDSDAVADEGESTDGENAAGDVSAEFCTARVDLEQAFLEEDPEAGEAALAQLRESAPESLLADVGTVAEAIQVNPDLLFEDDDVIAARTAIDEVVLADCGFEVIDVTAGDYEFDGIPDTVDAGTTAFRLTNDGTEMHEVVIVGLPDDLDESAVDFVDRVDEMFESGEEEAAMELIDFGTAAFAAPGESDVGIAQLEPGPYVALCFIPVGSVGEEEGDGPPHYHQGMIHEFTVN